MAVAKTSAAKKTNDAVATKSTTTKAETKKVETAAPVKTEVKAAEKTVAKEETNATKTVVKAEAAKEVKKAPAAKKTTAKKTTTKKTTKKGAKRGPKPAAERTIELHVQYGGKEVAYTDLVNQIRNMWKEQGKRETSLKSINIYVKPEEYKAYYVINDDITGEIEF